MRRVALPAVLVGLVLAITACSQSTSPSSASDKAAAPVSEKKIDQSVTVKTTRATGVVTVVSMTTSTKSKFKADDVPPQSGSFLVLDVNIESKSGPFHVNPVYFRLKTAEGKLIKQTDGRGSYAPDDPELAIDDVEAGQKVTGKVGFDSTALPGLKVEVSDTFGTVHGEIAL